MTVKFLIIHHTAVSRAKNAEQFEAVKKYHIARGWGDIGYHYFIESGGRVIAGRDETRIGAHTIGYNEQSLGIALAGNFDAELPTAEQEKALEFLLLSLKSKYPGALIKYHREFAHKTCPGKLISDNWASNLYQKKFMETNVKICKRESGEFGFYVPARNPAALESMAMNFGIEFPKDENGNIDWENVKIDFSLE